MNSTGSALPVSGVAHETSNQTAKPKLLNQVRIVLRSRYNNQRTESAYLNWIKRFILFHNKRHPAEMAETEVNQFLTHLAINEKVSASTQNQTLSALLFRYRHVLDLKPGQLGAVIRARKSKLRNQIRQRAVFQDAIGAMTKQITRAWPLIYVKGKRRANNASRFYLDKDTQSWVLRVSK